MPKKKRTKKAAQIKTRQPSKPSFLEGPIRKTRIRIVGVGGGGGSIVSEIAQKINYPGKKISFVVANTDSQALRKTSSKVIKFRFGKDLTFGLGAGMDPELGNTAAQKEKERITNLLEGQDLLILISCLGGGVGSGATPVFAKISKKLGNATFGIFTLPFKFEGEKKVEIARDSLRLLRHRLNTLAIIPNERIFRIVDKKTPLVKALSIVNKNLTYSLQGLIEMIYQPGLINIDFADLKTILGKKGKIAYFSTVEMKQAGQIQKMIEELISDPLYPYTIKGAKGILFNIFGEQALKLSEVNQISRTIWKLVQGKAKIIFGISENKKEKDRVKITLLATGCRYKIPFGPKEIKVRKKKKKPKKKKNKAKIRQKPKKKKPKPIKKIKKKEKAKVTKKKIQIKSVPIQKEKKKRIKFSIKKTKKKDNKKKAPKIRRNAIQIKKDLEEEENKLLAQEKIWETPAFLRRKS